MDSPLDHTIQDLQIKINILKRPSFNHTTAYSLVGHIWSLSIKGVFVGTVIHLGDGTDNAVERKGRRRTRTRDPRVKVLVGKIAVIGLESSRHGEAVKRDDGNLMEDPRLLEFLLSIPSTTNQKEDHPPSPLTPITPLPSLL